MKYVKFRNLLCGFCLVSLIGFTDVVYAGDDDEKRKDPRFPVKLTLVSPVRARDVSIQHHSGWPLTFRIIPRVDVSLVVPAVGSGPASAWPELGATSFLMLQDLDGCPSAGGRITGPEGQPFCPDVADDELWIEFTPDEDYPNVVDEYGFDELREAMKDPARRPTINYAGGSHTFGPRVHDTLDGLGYGANDDLTGFVLLADTGVSTVLSELETVDNGDAIVTRGWEPLLPMQNRNLAGFMTSVGYELNDERQRTTITTSLTIPRHLTERRYLEDQIYCEQGPCDTYRRVEGAPPVLASEANIDNHDVTFRAFVVQGVAPAVMIDCNFDNKVSAADARCMGYRLLSREKSFTIRQIGRADECNKLADPWGTSAVAGRAFVDFDGNGNMISLSCPGGSTGGGLPPRQRVNTR